MSKKINRLKVNFEWRYNILEKSMKINHSQLILERQIKILKVISKNVVNKNVNIVNFEKLTLKNLKDLLSLDNFPKVTESVLNTLAISNYSREYKPNILELYLYSREYKTNIYMLCIIAIIGYLNIKEISKLYYENIEEKFILSVLSVLSILFLGYLFLMQEQRQQLNIQRLYLILLFIAFLGILIIMENIKGLPLFFVVKDKNIFSSKGALKYFILGVIAVLAIWQMFSPFIIARLSIITNLFGFLIRTYAVEDKHKFAKYIVPVLKFFTKSRICCHLLVWCADFNDKFFYHKFKKTIDTIIIISRFIVYLGWAVRPLIALAFPLPYAGSILFVLGVNGLFRAIINLGIVLTSGDSLIKQLLQGLRNNLGKNAPRIPPNIPTPPEEPNNNDNDNKKDSEKKDDKTNTEKDDKTTAENQEKNTKFNYFDKYAARIGAGAGLGSLFLGGFGLIYTIFNKDNEKTRIENARIDEGQKQRHEEFMQTKKEEKQRHEEFMQTKKEEKQRHEDLQRWNKVVEENKERRHQEQVESTKKVAESYDRLHKEIQEANKKKK